MTAARSSLNPATTLISSYFDNDKVRTQTVAGVGTQTWTLDPIGRFSAYTFTPQVGPGGSTSRTGDRVL